MLYEFSEFLILFFNIPSDEIQKGKEIKVGKRRDEKLCGQTQQEVFHSSILIDGRTLRPATYFEQ
jgi:hypothetical protein